MTPATGVFSALFIFGTIYLANPVLAGGEPEQVADGEADSHGLFLGADNLCVFVDALLCLDMQQVGTKLPVRLVLSYPVNVSGIPDCI